MRENTAQHSEAFGSAILSAKAERKIRRFLKANFAGGHFSDDIKQNPYLLSTWVFSSAALASVLSLRLAIKMRTSEAFREHFKDVVGQPINPKLFENELRSDPETGELDVSSWALFKRQKNAAKANLNYLVEYGLGKMPCNTVVKTAQRLHARFSRYPMPTLFNDHSKKSSSIKGAAFALASLGAMEPSDMAAHLCGRDRDMYIQEYATLEV